MLTNRDHFVAEVFGLSYQRYLLQKEQSYRWRVLAPKCVEYIEKAERENWSHEKLSAFIDADEKDCIVLRRRFRMTEKIKATQSENSWGEGLRRGLEEWFTRFEELSESQRKSLSEELCRFFSNRLADAGDKSALELSQAAEKADSSILPLKNIDLSKIDFSKNAQSLDKGNKSWGPSWKD